MNVLLLAGLLFLLLRRKQTVEGVPKPLPALISIVETITDIVKVVVLNRFPVIEKISGRVAGGIDTVNTAVAKAVSCITPPLAWAWLLCLILTLTDVFTPLEMANSYLRSAAHGGTWLLVFFAARRFSWSYTWPARLWLASVAITLISAVLALWPLGLPFIYYIVSFFAPVQPWQTTYVYFQRGQSVVVDQQHRWQRAHHRRALIEPFTPFFQWVDRQPYLPYNQMPVKPTGTGWQVVNLTFADSKLEAAEQALVRRRQEDEHCYQELYRRDDSLIRIGRHPELVLPPVSQRGANTLGFRLQSAVWATRACCQEPCPISAVTASWKKAQLPNKYDFTLQASPCISHTCQSIYLVVCGVAGPGTYRLGEYDAATRTINGSFLRLSDAGGIYLSKPALQLTITRFDTVARVVAGTFEASVVSRAENAPTLAVQQGRFDVHFDSPPSR
ncbi:hypothetical protein [Hymenobacter glacieicola]|uniref:Uncharacterized protein n=1 Tax=Hymenobacter glacieicola TaxID=1562124 RepID=A0ABQ1X3Z1_9BACT|nr:hypothetical protein [Hymenobacter glacieicola]GGG52912.1 hypothetical protein GCM10011378_31450 [Hymenobacter glacieicola]